MLSFYRTLLSNMIKPTLQITQISNPIERFYREKNIPNQFNPLPYAFTFVLASLWWYYGEIVSDSHMIIVNAVGAIVEGIYCCLIMTLCSCSTKKRQD